MHRHELRPLDLIGGADRPRAEAHVRDGDRAGLLRVVDEVALREERRLAGDDRHRALGGADRSVAAETEEERAHALALGREIARPRQAGVRDVVDDAHREVVARRRRAELVEDALRHRGGELLRRQSVATAHDARHRALRLGEGRHHVLVERLAERARLLGAIEHRDRARARRDRSEQRRGGERPEQPQHDESDAFAARDERIDALRRGARARAHQHDHALGVGRADVVDEPVAAPGARGEARRSTRRRSRAPRRGTDCTPRAPGRTRPGSAPNRAVRVRRA